MSGFRPMNLVSIVSSILAVLVATIGQSFAGEIALPYPEHPNARTGCGIGMTHFETTQLDCYNKMKQAMHQAEKDASPCTDTQERDAYTGKCVVSVRTIAKAKVSQYCRAHQRGGACGYFSGKVASEEEQCIEIRGLSFNAANLRGVLAEEVAVDSLSNGNYRYVGIQDIRDTVRGAYRFKGTSDYFAYLKYHECLEAVGL